MGLECVWDRKSIGNNTRSENRSHRIRGIGEVLREPARRHGGTESRLGGSAIDVLAKVQFTVQDRLASL
jgi:hypothetical protein